MTSDDKSSTTPPTVKINSSHVRQLPHHRADARRGGWFKARPPPSRRWVQLKHLVSSNRWTARNGPTRRPTRDQMLHTQKRIVSARCRLNLGSKSYLVLLRVVLFDFCGGLGGGVQVSSRAGVVTSFHFHVYIFGGGIPKTVPTYSHCAASVLRPSTPGASRQPSCPCRAVFGVYLFRLLLARVRSQKVLPTTLPLHQALKTLQTQRKPQT